MTSFLPPPNPERGVRACSDPTFLAHTSHTLGTRLLQNTVPFTLWYDRRVLGTAWRPRSSFADCLRYQAGPLVFLVQEAVNPNFTLSKPFTPLPADDRAAVRSILREVLNLLVDRAPNSVPSTELQVPSESSNMLRILRVLVSFYGFHGDNIRGGEGDVWCSGSGLGPEPDPKPGPLSPTRARPWRGPKSGSRSGSEFFRARDPGLSSGPVIYVLTTDFILQIVLPDPPERHLLVENSVTLAKSPGLSPSPTRPGPDPGVGSGSELLSRHRTFRLIDALSYLVKPVSRSFLRELQFGVCFLSLFFPTALMALGFALLQDYYRGQSSAFRTRTQFEIFFLDLDSEEDMVRYLRRPEVVQFSVDVLVPLRDTVMLGRDRFRTASPILRDSLWIRHETSNYLRYLWPVRQAIEPNPSVAPRRRIPTPSKASLLYMMRLVCQFGFEGDEITDLQVVYNHADETVFAMAAHLVDVPREESATLSEIRMSPAVITSSSTPLLSVQITHLDPSPPTVSRGEVQRALFELFLTRGVWVMEGMGVRPARVALVLPPVLLLFIISSFTMNLPSIIEQDPAMLPPRTVLQLASVPETLKILLPHYLLSLPVSHPFSEDMHGMLHYFEQVVGPYAQLLNKVFPSRARELSKLLPDVAEYLLPHVGNLLRYLFVRRLDLFPPEAITTLCLMQKFHSLLGQPSYDIDPGLELMLHGWVTLMLGSARQNRLSYKNPIDIRTVPGLSHVLCIPSWTLEEITLMLAEEVMDPWLAEKYWVHEHIEACNRAGKDLSNVLADVADVEWYPNLGL
ncbi:hypothetical protein C8R46DRAFT_1030586 [Mycena filopes]|nr:hypothetical protein C8R46DRAFT_1030586 [Mycena filopes]